MNTELFNNATNDLNDGEELFFTNIDAALDALDYYGATVDEAFVAGVTTPNFSKPTGGDNGKPSIYVGGVITEPR